MKFGRAIAAVGSTAVVLGLAGCASKPAAPPPPATFVLPSAAAASLTPAVYMSLASNVSLFAIRAAEIAEQRGNERTRVVARDIIRDQGGVAAQLSYAGRRIDLLPTATLHPPLAGKLDELRQSNNFDADFKRLVGEALGRSLAGHEVFAREGTSPTLRPVAQMAAPVTKKNLDALKR